MVKRLESLIRGLEIVEASGDLQTPIEGLSYDSRKTVAGDLFVAIPGTREDGSRYVLDALRKGARAIVVEAAPQAPVPVPIVRVANCRRALARAAAAFYEVPSQGFHLIGVTGTNGKTTTTLLLESILARGGHSVGVLGTLGYRWNGRKQSAPMTTPESLDLQRLFFDMRRDATSHVVMEVSSHALALERVEGCTFEAGVFTNLSQDHLDFHETMEAYFAAKALLFEKYLKPDGTSAAVINADDPFGERLCALAKGEVWSYSLTPGKGRVGVARVELKASGIDAELSTPQGMLEIHSPLIGRLNLYNLLAASTTALALGLSKEAIAAGLESLSLVDGRLQRVEVPESLGFEVVVDYAHTPDAMEKSLTCLREMTRGRLLVVFGCGGDRDRGKRPLMGRVAAQLGDLVILTSDNPRSEAPEAILQQIEPGVQELGLSRIDPCGSPNCKKAYTVEADRKQAIRLALSWAGPGDVVFIGGKGHETYQIVGGQVYPFDDRLVVRECLEAGHEPPFSESR